MLKHAVLLKLAKVVNERELFKREVQARRRVVRARNYRHHVHDCANCVVARGYFFHVQWLKNATYWARQSNNDLREAVINAAPFLI